MSINIADALAQSIRLDDADHSAKVDVERLLCFVLQCERSYLFTWPERELSLSQQQHYSQLLERRKQGEPIAHILGYQGFWSFDLEVSSDTLIPRADTEVVVEVALRLLADRPAPTLVDLGTGTGAIALAIAVERPDAQVMGCDLLDTVVALAERNQKRLKVSNVEWLQSDWFSALQGKQFDLIVSNPPYIEPDDHHLCEGDLRYEPHTALVADEQGLADLRHILQTAPRHLNRGGWLVLEHGYDQAAKVRALLQMQGYSKVESIQDYGGNERVSIGCIGEAL